MSKEISPLFQLRNYILDFWRSDKKNFLGKTLTIIDASISDPGQRKGIKDLIHNAFYSSDYLEDETRNILLEFAKKFCKDQAPETKEDENSFKGRLNIKDNNQNPLTSYFN